MKPGPLYVPRICVWLVVLFALSALSSGGPHDAFDDFIFSQCMNSMCANNTPVTPGNYTNTFNVSVHATTKDKEGFIHDIPNAQVMLKAYVLDENRQPTGITPVDAALQTDASGKYSTTYYIDLYTDANNNCTQYVNFDAWISTAAGLIHDTDERIPANPQTTTYVDMTIEWDQ